MKALSRFLTVVVVARNQAGRLDSFLQELAAQVEPQVLDYELVVVDNASEDTSVARLKKMATSGSHANLQIYALTKQVEPHVAAWVGLEKALGDHVAVLDLRRDDPAFLVTMLEAAAAGADVVFAQNRTPRPASLLYRLASHSFYWLYQKCCGVHLAREAPAYRLLSRQVIHFILKHPSPQLAYRHLPATAGFARENLFYEAPRPQETAAGLFAQISHSLRLLVATTSAPMRLVSGLSLGGALLNLLYSVYVIGVALFKADVAPGWVTLSLQQSGMFLLLSLVLVVLGEYVAHMVGEAGAGPLYHVGQEFTSVRMTRRERLNIEEALPSRVERAS